MTDSPEYYPVYVAETPEDSAESKPEEYKVGRGKPPREHQWKPPQSGNPSGKRKREETYADLFGKELNKRIGIQENGKRIRITKRRAWIKGVVNRTLQRDRNAEKTFLQIEKPTDASQAGGVDFYIIG
jgi:hypothetical protein